MKRRILRLQGTYYLLTGVAPLLSRRRFEAITGPKRDWWLAQTIAGLVTVVGIAFLSASRRERPSPEITGLAVGFAAVLAVMDALHSGRGRNSNAYALDAVVQCGFLTGTLLGAHRSRAAGRLVLGEQGITGGEATERKDQPCRKRPETS